MKFSSALFAFLLIVTFLCPIVFAANEPLDELDLPPIICTCAGVSLDYGDVIKWPGDSALVPVYLSNTQPLVIMQINAIPNSGNVRFYRQAINTTGTPWTNATFSVENMAQDSSSCDINVSGNLTASASLRRVFDLKFRILNTAPFDTTFGIGYTGDCSVRKQDSLFNCTIEDPTTGTIRIKNDTTKIFVVGVYGNSNQGMDENDQCKVDSVVKVPIKLLANYPCLDFGFWLRIPDSVYYAGWTSKGYYSQIDVSGDSVYIWGSAQNGQVNTQLYLGDLKLKIGNFRYRYLQYTAFDTTFYLQMCPAGSEGYPIFTLPKWEVYAADGVQYGDITQSISPITIPMFTAYLDIKDALVGANNIVGVPVTLNTSIWTQHYRIYIDFDPDYLAFDSVHSAANPIPPVINASYYDTTPQGRDVYEIHSSTNPGSCKFVHGIQEKTIFTVYFTASNLDPGDSTEVRWNETFDYSRVYDYFSPNGQKLERNSSVGYGLWTASHGMVAMPGTFTLDATATYRNNNNFTADVNITHIDFTANKRATLDVYLPATLDSVRAGDFTLDSARYSLAYGGMGGDGYIVNLYPHSNITTTGRLCRIWFSTKADDNFIIKTGSGICFDGGRFFNVVSKGDTAAYHHSLRKPENDGPLPLMTSLGQNYPNPFNGRTIISFSLGQPGNVQLDIIDILGRQVRSLVDSPLPSGTHSVIWDGTNQSGYEVTAGTYFYILKTSDYRDVKRMLFLK